MGEEQICLRQLSNLWEANESRKSSMEMLGVCLPKTGCQEGISAGVVLLEDAALHVAKADLPQEPNADQRTCSSVQ